MSEGHLTCKALLKLEHSRRFEGKVDLAYFLMITHSIMIHVFFEVYQKETKLGPHIPSSSPFFSTFHATFDLE